MPTRFEVWRDTLTPEQVLYDYGTRRFCGCKCPARDNCNPKANGVDPLTKQCYDIFFEWVNGEADGYAK